MKLHPIDDNIQELSPYLFFGLFPFKDRFLMFGFKIYCNIIMLYHGQRLQIMLKYKIRFYVTFIEQDNG